MKRQNISWTDSQTTYKDVSASKIRTFLKLCAKICFEDLGVGEVGEEQVPHVLAAQWPGGLGVRNSSLLERLPSPCLVSVLVHHHQAEQREEEEDNHRLSAVTNTLSTRPR